MVSISSVRASDGRSCHAEPPHWCSAFSCGREHENHHVNPVVQGNGVPPGSLALVFGFLVSGENEHLQVNQGPKTLHLLVFCCERVIDHSEHERTLDLVFLFEFHFAYAAANEVASNCQAWLIGSNAKA